MIDVLELIRDPIFSTMVTLIRRPFVMEGGRHRATEERSKICAVVQPAGPNDMTQIAATVADSFPTETLSIWTLEPLCAGTTDRLCDLIETRGKRFSVTLVEDFILDGGYCKALATRISDD